MHYRCIWVKLRVFAGKQANPSQPSLLPGKYKHPVALSVLLTGAAAYLQAHLSREKCIYGSTLPVEAVDACWLLRTQPGDQDPRLSDQDSRTPD